MGPLDKLKALLHKHCLAHLTSQHVTQRLKIVNLLQAKVTKKYFFLTNSMFYYPIDKEVINFAVKYKIKYFRN
jgi:hypothetical protein